MSSVENTSKKTVNKLEENEASKLSETQPPLISSFHPTSRGTDLLLFIVPDTIEIRQRSSEIPNLAAYIPISSALAERKSPLYRPR
jgi:hypothetical protein